MKFHRRPKAFRSVALAVVVVVTYSFSSLAASSGNGAAQESPGVVNSGHRPATGQLVGSGELLLNGNPAPSGTTVLSPSQVGTGSDGNARVELGSIGNIRIRPDSSINLEFASDGFRITTLCETTHFDVKAGELEANLSPIVVLRPGDERSFDRGVLLRATPGAQVIVDCGDHLPGGFIGPGVFSGVLFAAVAASVPTAIAIGKKKQPISAIQP